MTQPRLKKGDPCFQWRGKHSWRDYSAQVNSSLVQAFNDSDGVGSCTVDVDGWIFVVDFGSMQQISNETGFKRGVRRAFFSYGFEWNGANTGPPWWRGYSQAVQDVLANAYHESARRGQCEITVDGWYGPEPLTVDFSTMQQISKRTGCSRTIRHTLTIPGGAHLPPPSLSDQHGRPSLPTEAPVLQTIQVSEASGADDDDPWSTYRKGAAAQPSRKKPRTTPAPPQGAPVSTATVPAAAAAAPSQPSAAPLAPVVASPLKSSTGREWELWLSAEEGSWWCCCEAEAESELDFFVVARPGNWALFQDPDSGAAYWYNSKSEEFFFST